MLSPDRPLHLAFLGCGRIAAQHRGRIWRLAPAVRCSFASRDPARAAEYARRYGGTAHWGRYADAIADPKVDGVVVTTPPSSHLDLTLAALRAGKDVIVEKPAFLRSGDVTLAEAAAAEAGRCVFVAENYCYKPLAGALREVVASGELGNIRFVAVQALMHQVAAGWRTDPLLAGGGALFEGGVHWVDLVAHLGLSVESVQAYRPGGCGGLERSILVVLRYAGGAVGTLHYSWETPALLRGLQLSRIAGTQGSITFESNGLVGFVRGAKRSRWLVPGLRDIAGYGAMFADFLGALGQGTGPSMTLARARRDLELIESAYGSLVPTAEPRDTLQEVT